MRPEAEADPVIRAAIERANRDCERGVRDLEAQVAAAPEWVAGHAFNGSSHVDPLRARLAGMLAFLKGEQ